MLFTTSFENIKVNQVFYQLSVKSSTNVSCQLNFRLFVSCQLIFWPFVSCQLTPSRPSYSGQCYCYGWDKKPEFKSGYSDEYRSGWCVSGMKEEEMTY